MILRRFVISYVPKHMKILTPSCQKMSTNTTEGPDVIVEEIDDKGILTLNRPKVLNALDLSMVRKIVPALKKWQEENKVCVIIKGAGDKAFCAGGDVKNIVEDARKGGRMGHDFFREEYTMNVMINKCKIPYIAFIHGIVIGGGVGLSIHGKYRIATEKSVFAMPETQIGFFPDIGGSYFLPRLEGKLGTYLALTGERLKGIDLLKANIATHYTPSERIPELENTLLKCQSSSDVEVILNKFGVKDTNPFIFDPVLDKINFCFGAPTIEEIIHRLKKDGSNWSTKTLGTLQKMSPTSLKMTLKALSLGSKLTLEEALNIEYRVAISSLTKHDFYEGVRALLIDKDQKPKWKPNSVADVTEDIVDSHFKELPDDMELKL